LDTAIPSLSENRWRGQIAQYLRDNAIQRIFAVGLAMTALAARLDEPQLQRRLAGYVDDLDIAISAIYVAVSELTSSESDDDEISDGS
jgi:signal transduction histidine kinase